jgi:hypothetical protein
MITNFSVFENNDSQPIFKKGDLIISEYFTNNEIYLVLNDAYATDDRVESFFIGFISKSNLPRQFSFNINIQISIGLKRHSIKNYHLRKLNDEERRLILDEMYSDQEKTYSVKYNLDYIEKTTGVDLKKLPELVYCQIRTSANKYNL